MTARGASAGAAPARAHKDTLEQVDGLEARAAADIARLERIALCLELTAPTDSLPALSERLAHLIAEAA